MFSVLFLLPFFASNLWAQSTAEVPYYRNTSDSPLGLEFRYWVEFDDQNGNFGASIAVRSSKSAFNDNWKIILRFPTETQRILDLGPFSGGKVVTKNTTDSRVWYNLEPLVSTIDPTKDENVIVFKGSYSKNDGNPAPTEVVFQTGDDNNPQRSVYALASSTQRDVPKFPTKAYINAMKKKYGYDQRIVITAVFPSIFLLGIIVIGSTFLMNHLQSSRNSI